jgi:hypothetical protein
MRWLNPGFLLALLPVFSMAQVNTLRLSNEVAPPGGIAQVKVTLTSPQPISLGRLGLVADLGFEGVSMFSSAGDVSGAAVRNASGTGISVRFTAPSGTLGTASDDYPILALAFRVPAGALPGTVFSVNLDGASSLLSDLLGRPLSLEVQPGSVTVGDNLSITDVLPGGGLIAANQAIRILGLGFGPKTQVRIKEQVKVPSSFINSNEIDLALPTPFVLDGARIEARDPDGSSVTYFSYLRAIPIGQSARPLLARTDPIFASTLLTEALVPPTAAIVSPTTFTGLALQNPGNAPVTVTLEQYTGSSLKRRTSVKVPARSRILRETSEWLGIPPIIGTSWHVMASAPIQVLSLLGDERDGTVMPLSVLPL